MKAFTTKRPEGFEEVPGSQRKAKPLPPNAVLSDNPSEVDLFVGSTSKVNKNLEAFFILNSFLIISIYL